MKKTNTDGLAPGPITGYGPTVSRPGDGHLVEPRGASGNRASVRTRAITVLPDRDSTGNPRWKVTHSCYGIDRQLETDASGRLLCRICDWMLTVDTYLTRPLR